jgi:hypothetical protein
LDGASNFSFYTWIDGNADEGNPADGQGRKINGPDLLRLVMEGLPDKPKLTGTICKKADSLQPASA